ncbi:MAG: purine-nucleoside phosphorylase [Desulfurivibrionaceae bacterium]
MDPSRQIYKNSRSASAKDYRQKVLASLAFLKDQSVHFPEIILVLGTGLGGLAERIEEQIVVPYSEIPYFPRSTVTSHQGNLIFGILGGKRVAALQGRFHYYEGYSTAELSFPIRVLSLLGPETMIVSNASGGLNPAFQAGSLMVIRDHLNFIPDNPLRGINEDDWGPRFPDCSRIYDPDLIDVSLKAGSSLGLANMETGIYVAIPGPSLETPAETRYLRSCGADAVGMSTVPEVLVAVHAGLRILGISLVANVNDPDNQQPIILEDILEQGKKGEERFQQLLVEILTAI